MNRLLLACSFILLAPLLTHGQAVSTAPLHRIHPQTAQDIFETDLLSSSVPCSTILQSR